MSLLLPAVQMARSAARRVQCKSNIHNLAIAMIGCADAKTRFPASGHYGPLGSRLYHNWVVEILPWIERNDIYNNWDFDLPFDDPKNQQFANLQINVLMCPDDITVQSGSGNLSYVVNSGIGWTIPRDMPAYFHTSESPPIKPFDLNTNGIVCSAVGCQDGTPSDRDIYEKMGLFFLENWPRGSGSVRFHNTGSVRDGASQTLMFAENVRAGYDPNAVHGWAAAHPLRNTFMMSSYVCPANDCSPGNINYANANDHTNPLHKLESINSGLTQAEGEAPWPSSYHTGGVHVAFVDGHVHFLNDAIDGRVYAALISPQGSLLPKHFEQAVVGDSSY